MSKLEEDLKKVLEDNESYTLTIGGCGCCESPWITVHDEFGKELFESDGANLEIKVNQ